MLERFALFRLTTAVAALAALLPFGAIPAAAQTTKAPDATRAAAALVPPRIHSPQVHADGKVTFRFLDPNAHNVKLVLEGAAPVEMQKDDRGIWSVTVGPLPPEYYGYSFLADGVNLMDPSNPLAKPNLLNPQNMVFVPGSDSLPWQMSDVQHGVVHEHFYHSNVVGDNRNFYVYTPPDYNPRGKTRYPVLYLLHGYSDSADAWTAVGRANVILDNLIAAHKAVPMIVVMPLGYGAPQILTASSAGSRSALGEENSRKFTEALLTEVMPRVAKDYRVLSGPDHTAIAGLSMGGGEALYAGLNHLKTFGWIGAFSAGLLPDLDQEFPGLDAKVNSRLHLLWIACGEQDPIVGAFNRRLRAWLKARGVAFTQIATPGMHTWLVWRGNLAAFVPLLFHQKAR